MREVERLGAALARQSGQEEEEAVRHLWGKLGMLLQRGNAAILANRVPSFPAPAIDGRHYSVNLFILKFITLCVHCLSILRVLSQ